MPSASKSGVTAWKSIVEFEKLGSEFRQLVVKRKTRRRRRCNRMRFYVRGLTLGNKSDDLICPHRVYRL